MRTILRSAPIFVAVAALWACNKRPVEGKLPTPQVAGNQLFPQSTSRDLDILFVVDNSISMAGEQQTLLKNLDILMQALGSLQGGFPNAHIGVVSTDIGTGPFTSLGGCSRVGGDGGRLQHAARVPGCTPPGEPYINIENSNGELSGNIANVDTLKDDGTCAGLKDISNNPIPEAGDTAIDLCDIQAAFSCIAALGNQGCGFEQPLESARRALTCNQTESCTNPGFRRESAVLAIVLVGDEDDCSARRDDLFNPQFTATLGAATSFRCFEYGVTCSPPVGRTPQTLNDCRSKTAADVATPDDLYLYPIADYYNFFSTLGPEGRVILAGITGPYRPGDTITTVGTGSTLDITPACTNPEDGSEAAPDVRMHELIRQFGANGVVLQDVNMDVGICTNDFSPALSRLGEVIRSVLMPGCIGNPLIYEGEDGPELIETPDQATCSVIEVTNAGLTNEARNERERCVFENEPSIACTDASLSPGPLADSSPLPCWYICDNGTADLGGCDYRWQMRFCRDRPCDPLTPAPPLTDAYVQCLSCNPQALGCLCGDGVCQDGHKENNVALPDYGENVANCCSDCSESGCP